MTTQSGRRSREGRKIPIRPTGPKDEKGNTQYTDIALTGNLNMHAGQATSARDLMWRRYGFFLVANSLFLPFLARLEDPILLFPGAVFGIVICWIWRVVFQYDQQVHIDRLSLASRFRYSHLPPDANVFVFALRPE